ncbi:MAG TPA: hypothetical protein VI837_10315 [Blastocatellia bacterium]|nr:hypothetical protein [Blastocatellia bacterium]
MVKRTQQPKRRVASNQQTMNRKQRRELARKIQSDENLKNWGQACNVQFAFYISLLPKVDSMRNAQAETRQTDAGRGHASRAASGGAPTNAASDGKRQRIRVRLSTEIESEKAR